MELKNNKIKFLRKQYGYSLDEVAKKINSDNSTISRYENGQRKISSKNLIKLSELFGVSPKYLLGIEERENGFPLSKDDIKKENMAFFGNREISDADKEEIFNELQEFYFRYKLKRKK